MPGYTEPLNSVEPKPTAEQKDITSRFMPGIPKLTMIQMVIVALIVVYAWTARKVKGVVVSALALTIALLHMYDHVYRVKRGAEHPFFMPALAKKEAYGCKSCM